MLARVCLRSIDRQVSVLCAQCALCRVPQSRYASLSFFLSFIPLLHTSGTICGRRFSFVIYAPSECLLIAGRPPVLRLAHSQVPRSLFSQAPMFRARADVLMPYFFASGREGLAPMRSKVRSLAPCFSFYPSEEEEAGIKIFCASSFLPLFSSSHLLGRVSPRPPSRRIRMRMPNARTRIHFSCANPNTLHRSTRNGGGGA